ncbi:Holliday junction branch migration protein RuvA [Halalkalibacterium halodurans]|uniref:Holliday junction branch migration protein RuvA n=1 Tax=Halalkalibacterium halodurans TaxID=86665 RepID=UPI002AAA133B|nr:Holliday junction branch migration protein RuvA [Halalkalibacterium halodurans]MDY7221747.1 Holliday junction branch migration protein RuvA [Halalkalibacterium halodurans]MDY7241023.1 Holliday junction branch migration protein RuvA [Halalkalibacterium halodurans]
MIDYLRGTLTDIDHQYAVVEVHGVGYQVYCPNPYEFEKERDSVITIYTYQYVREDVIRLYGFRTKEKRSLFEKLLNVSGIGPKGALAILATGQPEHVIQAIEEEDEAFLVKFPGVGKKTARQIILDLKGKVDELHPGLFSQKEEQPKPHEKNDGNQALDEAMEALKALGYVEKELKKVKPKLEQETLTTDAYIKKALQLMLNR